MEYLNWKRLLPIAFLAICLFMFFYFNLQNYFSFQYLKTNRELLLNHVSQNYFLSAIFFLIIYIVATAISAPGAIFITMTAGFLFGFILGTTLVVFGATIGATIIFHFAKTVFYDLFYNKAGKWYKKMAIGFGKNSISYLLFLRLVPLFPFWIINIVPAFFGINTRTFIWTTFIGIIPGTITYVALGSGLGAIFDQDQTPNLRLIFEPKILLPLIALAILSLIPVIYKWRKK